MKELNIDAKTENLDKVIEFVEKRLKKYDCPQSIITQLDIAIEEIFANIAHYAYSSGVGKATVRVDVKEKPLSVEITFCDEGIQYNPLDREDPDTTLSAEERNIGGLGIFMVKKSMDAVEYEYADGKNILKISKDIKNM